MIVTTMDGIAGRITQETLGVVRGTQLWTKRVIKSSFGGIRNFEVTGMKEMDAGLKEAKDHSHKTMIEQARAMGADSVIGVRIDVIEMSNGVFCVNTTGTAVKTIALPALVPAFDASLPPEIDMDFDPGFFAAHSSYQVSSRRH
jgi:uncharacterized protein YbjQ (UPF0145 family)